MTVEEKIEELIKALPSNQPLLPNVGGIMKALAQWQRERCWEVTQRYSPVMLDSEFHDMCEEVRHAGESDEEGLYMPYPTEKDLKQDGK